MQVDDVAGPDEAGQGLGVLLADAHVFATIRLRDPFLLAVDPVQPIVEALGDPEELGVAAHHAPADIDPGAAGVGEERVQQLGDTASGRGRVDVPDGPPLQQCPRPPDRLLDDVVAFAEHHAEPLRGHRRDRNRFELHRSRGGDPPQPPLGGSWAPELIGSACHSWGSETSTSIERVGGSLW
jgi:hypothetical protein